ncbi:PorT family protein [Parabacteroides sp. AM58-2XD]|uniref:porin family protein n=1 Tax=Parabacteroides TaxID=375288 RepID=UPI000FE207C1|nr:MULTISPECIES: porin family protein [Parabacteroides]MCM0719979.1 PorT family protein [Parabacteroides sp. W1-Q-101]RGZ02033.1 PorT family protein [Parabacteroides sp. AM58-2XD]GKG73746.1 membrane protein [Parabacteroides goldsteinii]GKG79682.1 membrane protein [Parabacteroides goldsteinii]
MKKVTGLVLVILMVFIAVPAKSQLKFGIKGGVNISSVHMNSDILKADNVTGFQIGPMIETTIPLIGIGLDAAILYSQKGMDVKSEAGTSTNVKTDYIDVPVNLKWKFGLPIIKGYLAAGPYIGFRVGGDKFWEIPGSVVGQVKAKNFSAGLNFGAGVELISHLQVGINYGLGLTDNYSAEKYDMNARNRGWSITAAILF